MQSIIVGLFMFVMVGAFAETTVLPLAAPASENTKSWVMPRLTASSCLDFARTEFAKYLPETEIALELKVDKSLGEDAFRVRERAGALEITGGNERGCLYGVYSFLENECGARFYTSWCTRPAVPPVAVPQGLDRTERPAFEVRVPYWWDVINHPEFAAKLRVNANPFGTLPDCVGGNACRFGKGMPSCHTLGSLLPDAHNVCLTDATNLAVVTERVLARIAADPDARFYGISYDDNETWCHCPRCEEINREEGSPAGTLVQFVNAIADVVAKRFPKATLETLAYQHTVVPPKKTRLRKNVVVCVCSNHCEFTYPFDESPFEETREFSRALLDWGKMSPLYVWDYTTCFCGYPKPFPNGAILVKNIRYFRDRGVRFLFEQGDYQGVHADFGEWKTYLQAKAMWNPDLDEETLRKDFFEGYYGAGAPFVDAYYRKAIAAHRADTDRTKRKMFFGSEEPLPFCTPEFIAESRALWGQADEATRSDKLANYNVRMGAMSLDFLELLIEFGKPVQDVARQRELAARLRACIIEARPKALTLLEFPQSLLGRIYALMSTSRDIQMPEVMTKGDVNLKNVSVTDDAAWIWSERDDAKFVRFKCEFDSDGSPLRLHVTADNRYTLYVDCRRIGRGPDRGTPDHWTFRSYEIGLTPGRHRLEAVVSFITEEAPLAQLSSGRPGFLLKAEGKHYGPQLTTGRGNWRARVFENVTFRKPDVNAFGIGKTVLVDGNSPWDDFWNAYVGETKVVRPAVGGGNGYGCDFDGPYLYPSSLPAQLDEVKCPGRAVAVAETTLSNYLWCAEDRAHPTVEAFNRHLRGCPLEIPPQTTWSVLWDLGDYYCAYPEMEVAPGTGAGLTVKWGWAESLAKPTGVAASRALDKDNRGEFVGKSFVGIEDESRHKGDAGGEGMSLPWWRCGRWCRLTFMTGEKSARIRRTAIAETRYPIAHAWSFDCDDSTIAPVLAICRRGLEMNSHEMSFDCPYYEQQMYGGDSRIQFLVHAAMSSDDRLVRRNIDLFDWSRRSDGRLGMNTPTRGTQDSTSFTFMWPMMLADYSRWHANRAWLRTKLPGLLHTMEGLHNFERADGLVVDLPGWNFVDWTAWPGEKANFGEPKDVDRLSGILNLFYLYSLRSAAEVCAALEEPDYAATFRRRYERTAEAYVKTFWCEGRKMLSDTDTMDSFSQHSQALAVILGVLSGERDALVRKALVERTDLVPATVSFKHYVFEAFAKMGRGDLILKELDLWRGYVAKGLKTGQEMSDPTRSDCHGWSSHPVYHLLTAVAGVTPSAPFFGKVRVAPKPGGLKFVRATVPTPKGRVSVDLRFGENSASGTVTLPDGLDGDFEYGEIRCKLVSGLNQFK